MERIQPEIVKYVITQRTGVQLYTVSRYAIGYILRGRKLIYYGDNCLEVSAGQMFYLSIGNHFVEHIPDEDNGFEQIVFFYTPAILTKILSVLNLSFGIDFANSLTGESLYASPSSYAISQDWTETKILFQSVNNLVKENSFQNPAAARLVMMLLVYMILDKQDCSLRDRLVANINQGNEKIERVIHDNIFRNLSVAELAEQCGKSETAFKKEFERQYHTSPHKWVLGQRLMYSRTLLLTTSMTISEIGVECNFPNTSHYIKLFRKEYGVTPHIYRTRKKDDIEIEQA